MAKINSRRKQKYVSKPIQGRLMRQIVLYWVLYHFILWHAMFMVRYAEVFLSATTARIPLSLQDVYAQFARDNASILLCALVILPIVVVDMLKLSHRVAGPLVRFQKTLQDLTEGKQVDKVKLRKGDLLIEFQDEFNKYLAWLADRKSSAATTSANESEEQCAQDVEELSQTVRGAVCPTAASTSSSLADETENSGPKDERERLAAVSR